MAGQKTVPTTLIYPGHGIIAKRGPRDEDWEPVKHLVDLDIDQYEVMKQADRIRGKNKR